MPLPIAQVVVGLPVEGPFDYSLGKRLNNDASLGTRVKVIFNKQLKLGVIVGFKEKSSFKNLNSILSVLDHFPSLDKNALKLTKDLSEYYGCSWGEAIEAYLPPALRTFQKFGFIGEECEQPVDKKSENILVHDAAGYKRWPFIFEQIQNTLDRGEGVIWLVPETAYLKEILIKLQRCLKYSLPIAVLDKKFKTKKELEQWQNIKEGKIHLVLGTRSAVFSPVRSLGLIVICEEEHAAYRQEQTPHYHVGYVCHLRSQLEQCSLLWVSSVPSVELFEQAQRKKWTNVTFSSDHPASMHAIDMSNYKPRKSFLSFPLQNAMEEALKTRKKILLFLNRRGFSTLTRCEHCGFIIKCQRCDTPLIYLYVQKMMLCRYCQKKNLLPKICPSCQKSYLRSTGTGVEKLESEIARIYPGAGIVSYDKESRGVPKESDITIATQAILKEENWTAAVVGMIDFDAQLNHPDFRCAHKAFFLLIRLRQMATEKFFVQTRLLGHYCLKAAAEMDFNFFYKEELRLRKELGLPPFRALLLLKLRGLKEETVLERSQTFFEELNVCKQGDMEISDPYPDAIVKLRDQYRYNIMLKGETSPQLLMLAKTVLKSFKRKRGVIVSIYVDP